MKKPYLLLLFQLLFIQPVFSYIHEINLWQNRDHWVLFFKDVHFGDQELTNIQGQVLCEFLPLVGSKPISTSFLNESSYLFLKILIQKLNDQNADSILIKLDLMEQTTLFIHGNTKVVAETQKVTSNIGNLGLIHSDIRGKTINDLEGEVSELITNLCDLLEIDECELEAECDENIEVNIDPIFFSTDEYKSYETGFTSYLQQATIQNYMNERIAEYNYLKRHETRLQKYCPEIYQQYLQAVNEIRQIFAKYQYTLTISQAITQIIREEHSFKPLIQIRDCSYALLKCITDLSFFIVMNECWSAGSEGLIICAGAAHCNSLEEILSRLNFTKNLEFKQVELQSNILTNENLGSLLTQIGI